MIWREISGGWVYLPSKEIKGIIHFLGGAFVATAPQISYRSFLEPIGQEGYAMIATPFLNTFDHIAIAREVLNRFETILQRLHKTNSLGKSYFPIYGIGHSMGCKLHLIIGSLFEVQRAGNILISFNNYPVRRAIPFADQLPVDTIFDLEFTPSPAETKQLIAEEYSIRRNLLLKFRKDDIDQTTNLNQILQQKFSDTTALRTLPGNHLTPLSQNIEWQTGDIFTPLDAIGQWFKQEFSKDLPLLQKEVLFWLNPASFLGK